MQVQSALGSSLPKLPGKTSGNNEHGSLSSGEHAASNRQPDPSLLTGYLPSQRNPSKIGLIPQPFSFNERAKGQTGALPPGAIKRRTRLAQRKHERESWRLDRLHQVAVRDPEGIVLPGLSLSKTTLGAAVEGGEDSGPAITPHTRWRLLNEGFREGDDKHDGTVSNTTFVSLLRLLELDLGDDATLDLLRKYNQGGRSNYLLFLRNVKRWLFPHAGSPDGGLDRSGDEELEEDEEEGQGAPESPEPDEIVMAGLRFRVAHVWGQWRQSAERDEEALMFPGGVGGVGGGAGGSLESQLLLQRLMQRFLRSVSQAEMDVLVRGYHLWCRDDEAPDQPPSAEGREREREVAAGKGGALWGSRRSMGARRGLLGDQQYRVHQSEQEQRRRLEAKRRKHRESEVAGRAEGRGPVAGGGGRRWPRTWQAYLRELMLLGAEEVVHQVSARRVRRESRVGGAARQLQHTATTAFQSR